MLAKTALSVLYISSLCSGDTYLRGKTLAASITESSQLSGTICHLARRTGLTAAHHIHNPVRLQDSPFFILCARADEGRNHDARGWSAAGVLEYGVPNATTQRRHEADGLVRSTSFTR